MKSEKAYNFTITYAGNRMKTKGIITQYIQWCSIPMAQKIIRETADILDADFFDIIEQQETGGVVSQIDLPKIKYKNVNKETEQK